MLLSLLYGTAAAAAKQPHLVMILVDDFGHANLGYQRNDSSKEVVTPNMDRLAGEGVVLERMVSSGTPVRIV